MKAKTKKIVAAIVKPAAVPMTPARAAELFAHTASRVMQELNAKVEQGERARAEFATRINKHAGALMYDVSWGYGVKEDAMAVRCMQAIDYINEEPDLLVALANIIDVAERDRKTRYHATSSNPFSNAMDLVNIEVCKDFVQLLEWKLSHLVEMRAEMEVL